MTLTYKEYLLIAILVTLSVIVVLWGIQKRRADTLMEERALNQGFQTQERVTREYIPMKLEERGSDELTTIGTNLWGE